MNGWCRDFSFNQQSSVCLEFTWYITNAADSEILTDFTVCRPSLTWPLLRLQWPTTVASYKTSIFLSKPPSCSSESGILGQHWLSVCDTLQTQWWLRSRHVNNLRLKIALHVFGVNMFPTQKLTCCTATDVFDGSPESTKQRCVCARTCVWAWWGGGGFYTFKKMFHPCECFLQVSLGRCFISKAETFAGREWLITFILSEVWVGGQRCETTPSCQRWADPPGTY